MPHGRVLLSLFLSCGACMNLICRPAEFRHTVKFSTLAFRFMKYATRERKNGRVPFIDPFATNPCRQVYGKSFVSPKSN